MKTNISKYILLLFLALSFTFFSSGANARERDGDVKTNDVYLAKKAAVGTGGISSYININGISSFFDWQGVSGFNPNVNGSGTYYPRGKVGVIYRDGLVWGGLVRDGNTPVKRVGGNTYSIGTIPGKIVNGVPENFEAQSAGNGVIRLYRIRHDFRTINEATLAADAADIFQMAISSVSQTEIDAIREQYALDWKEWPTDRNAPYYDTDGNGTYDPVLDKNGLPIPKGVDENGNDIGGDYPGFANGDQVLWYVINDMNDGRTRDLYGSPPIGLEIETTVWGYNVSTDQALGNAFFKRYFVKNLSGADIDSLYFAQWSDPDLGNAGDDYVGCDPNLSLMYAYNGTPSDADFALYGLAPGASGYDFLQGPIVSSSGDSGIFDLTRVYDVKNIGANAFSYFTAGGLPASDPTQQDYEGTLQWYNMLRGYLPTATQEPSAPYTTEDGTPTFFPLSGTPWNGQGDIDGWLEGPADRRMSLSTGPINMVAGEIQEIVVGEIAALSSSNLASAQKLVYYDQDVQSAYNNFFAVPKPPSAPDVKITPLGSKIMIDWGWSNSAVAATESKTAGYDFEGYNVYQIDDIGTVKKIATYDISNGVLVIFQASFSDELGVIISAPAQIGTDSGIQRFFTVDMDYFTKKRLQPGRTYRFAVTSYNHSTDATALVTTLESPLNVIPVVAQGAKPGDDYSNADPGEAIEVTRVGGVSDGGIDAVVINPVELKNDTYSAEFVSPLAYDLINSAGDTLLQNYQNIAYSGETDQEAADAEAAGLRKLALSPAVDGFALTGYGPPVGAKSYDYESGSRWIQGVNWGGAIFQGGVDVGANFYGSTVDPSDTWRLKLVAQDAAEVAANGYVSKGMTYLYPGWAANGQGEIPFAAYDMTDPDNPRRVNICFRETDYGDGATNVNHIWDMGWDAYGAGTGYDPADPTAAGNIGLGMREYTFFMNSDYNEGVDYDDVNWAPTSDVVWALWPRPRNDYLYSHFVIYWTPYFPNKPGVDKFTFSTTAPTIGDDALALAQFDKATVWPNPYYAYNTQETSNFSRFVTISNLPAKVTVRIFNLAGTLVRTLDENDKSGVGDQFLQWDLQNESGLPVASGLYVYYIDAPELGKTKVLKSFVVQAKQKLRLY